MRLLRPIDQRQRLRFDCETEGPQSFKANRSQIEVYVTLEHSTGFGAGWIEERLVARHSFAKRGYSYSRLNHYAETCLKSFREGEPLPGQLSEEEAKALALQTKIEPASA